MGGNSRIAVSWSDLPRDLLETIAKCFNNEIDVLRFRAVCSSWRFSTTPFKKFPCETVKLPFPFDPRTRSYYCNCDNAYFTLVERTVYRVELPESKQPNFWLVKIERLRDGKLRILNPVSNITVKILPETQMPKVLNILDFRVSEVIKAYTLTLVNPSKPSKEYGYGYAKKVILSVGKDDEYVVMAIDRSYQLWYTKSGDEKWTMVPDYNACLRFHDVVKYKGQFHWIDAVGGTWAFDSKFERTRVSDDLHYTALKRHLVELSNGELFLVEEVMNKDKRRILRPYNMIDECPCGLSGFTVRKLNVDIIIHKLDKNEREWFETKAVNDWIIVLGGDCSYSVSTKGLEGCKGALVFFPDWRFYIDRDHDDNFDRDYDDNITSSECYCSDCSECSHDDAGLKNFIANDVVKLKFRGFHGDSVGVCDYESGKTGSVLMFPEYADIFWPPPSWLNRG